MRLLFAFENGSDNSQPSETLSNKIQAVHCELFDSSISLSHASMLAVLYLQALFSFIAGILPALDWRMT